MDAKMCDRCGVFYNIELKRSTTNSYFNQVRKINTNMNMSSCTRAKYDLCHDCRKAFVEFMEGGKQ